MFIGTLSYNALDDSFVGEIVSVSLRSQLKIIASGKSAPNAADYRVFIPAGDGMAEVGAAWKRRTDEHGDILDLRIDDPQFPRALDCELIQATPEDSDFLIVWKRRPHLEKILDWLSRAGRRPARKIANQFLTLRRASCDRDTRREFLCQTKGS